MSVVSMKQLLEAGVHFGHQTRRWNPKMAEYIYMERNGIYIIDLQKTVKKLEEAYSFVRDLAANGQSILFVGTKKQAQEAVKEEAERVGMYYVNARWLGGMLTNFKTMRTRVDRLAQLKKMQEGGTFERLPAWVCTMSMPVGSAVCSPTSRPCAPVSIALLSSRRCRKTAPLICCPRRKSSSSWARWTSSRSTSAALRK